MMRPQWGRSPHHVIQIGLPGVLAIALAGIPLGSTSQPSIPSPEAAAEQAAALTPEELIQIEITDEIRDRLRFDPAWQPIHRAVQRDLMMLKWGTQPLDNPVWKQYGARGYPLFAYYAQSNDPTRRTYGVLGIRALGKPYTTLWLEQQINQRLTGYDFYLITANPAILINSSADAPYDYDWQTEFGLDDPTTRDRLIRLAQENLAPSSSPDYYGQFNLSFLQALLGYDAYSIPWPEPVEYGSDPAVQQWQQLEANAEPTEAQVQNAIATYRALTPKLQEYVLVNYLGSVKAEEISIIGRAVLQALAKDAQSQDRVWAIAELDRHGDPQASAQLETFLNEDLAQLAPLSRWASYEGLWDDLALNRATHAYYLLLGMVEKYPNSRFVQGAKAYGDLRGRSYFGGSERPRLFQERIMPRTAEAKLAAWQTWLAQYPDHPGADDATYFLARSLQDNNRIMEALPLWIKLMSESVGDNDARYLAWGHVRAVLEVGLTTEQLETLVQTYENQPIHPLLTYALAVHYARAQDYTKALEISGGLDLAAMDPDLLGSYYSVFRRWWSTQENYQAQLQHDMQNRLIEQRQRWQRLQVLQEQGTPEALYQLASDWAGAGGWKNGYLDVWEGWRTAYLPVGAWGNVVCTQYWVCNEDLRGTDAVRQSYQRASQLAIALQLYQTLLDTPNLSPQLREKTLFMMASSSLWQWDAHPLGETVRIHPTAGMTANAALPPVDDDDWNYDVWQIRNDALEQDYIGYLDHIIGQLKTEFPDSLYIDDLLFSRYAMSGEIGHLQDIVDRYPQGDRAHEAQFLLEQVRQNEKNLRH